MRSNASFYKLLVTTMILAHGTGYSQSTITYDVTARINVPAVLIIQGSEVQWYHPGGGATVGRHNGSNEATVITTTLDGVTNLTNLAWIPDWPEPPPEPILYEAYSSVLTNLIPALPPTAMTVGVAVLDGRGSVSIEQLPNETNNWTLMVRFADGESGSAFLTARIFVEPVSEPLEFLAIAGPNNELFRFTFPLTSPTRVATNDLGAGTFALIEDGPVRLYMFDYILNSLSVLDRFNGQLLSTTTLDQDVFGTRQGFDLSPNGLLYGVLPGMELRTVDPETGTTTFITNITGAARVESIAFAPDGTLYASGSIDNNGSSETLFILSITTGILTPIGQMNVADVDVITFGEDGKLYGVDTQVGETPLLRINPNTAFVESLGLTGLSEIHGLLGIRQHVTLSITNTGGSVAVHWPTNATGFGLERTDDLGTPGTWTAEGSMPGILGDSFVVTNSVTSSEHLFYRLSR